MANKVRLESGVEIAIFENNGFVGYSEESETQHVIITDTKRVSTYSLTDNKCIESWSVPQTSQFTSKAVYDKDNQCYIAVKKYKNLIKWSKETTDLAKIKPVLLSTAVHILLVKDGFPTLLVFDNGAVADLQTVLDNPKDDRPNRLPMNFNLKGCTCCYQGSERKVFLLATNKKNKVWSIFISTEGRENEEQQIVLQNQANNVSIVDYSLLPQEGSVQIITAWSNRDICLSVIPFYTAADHIDCCPLLTVESNTAVTWLGVDYFAIAGVKALDKDKPDKEFLTIWDSKFGTLQTKIQLPASVDKTPTNMISMEDTILLTRGSVVIAYRFSCPQASLAVALGCLRNNDTQNAITVQTDWKPNAKISVEKDNLLQEAMSMQKCPTEKDFASACEKLLARLNLNRFADSCFITSLLQHVARRCTQDKHFWPKKILNRIIESSGISASTCPEFLNIVLEKEDSDVLSSCFRYMSDIPEHAVVKSLQIYLRSRTVKGTEQESEVCNPLNDDLSDLINNVLNCNYNDVFLLERLKYLDLEEVLVLIEYLYYLLSAIEITQEVKVEKEVKAETVIDWICLLLDSHYSALVISNKAKSVLVNLYTAVEAQVQFVRELNSLKSLLHPILNSSITTNNKSKKANQLYRIEMVKLY